MLRFCIHGPIVPTFTFAKTICATVRCHLAIKSFALVKSERAVNKYLKPIWNILSNNSNMTRKQWHFQVTLMEDKKHTCQPSRIIRESPGYDTNLPVSRTGRFISRIKSSFELFCVLVWNLAHFQFKTGIFLIRNTVSEAFYTYLVTDKDYFWHQNDDHEIW